MSDKSDPFNIENLRFQEAEAGEAALRAEMETRKRGGKPEWLENKIAASRTGASKPKRARSQKRFTKFPGVWEEVLGRARVSGSAYAVAIVLLHEAWRLVSNGYRPDVKLSNLGLVGVQWRSNRNPIVSVHFLD